MNFWTIKDDEERQNKEKELARIFEGQERIEQLIKTIEFSSNMDTEQIASVLAFARTYLTYCLELNIDLDDGLNRLNDFLFTITRPAR